MSTNQSTRLRDVAARDQSTALAPVEGKDFPALLQKYLPEIARALPKHMSAERMGRILLTEFRKNPMLAKCEARSIFAAGVVSSQLGLEPGVLGQSFLVPYYNNKKQQHECQLIPGWQGLADLVARAGRASVWTGAVFEGDDFDYAYGDRPFVHHKPGDNEDMGALRFVYAIGRIKGSDWPVIEVWRMSKVLKHRDKYNKVGERHYSFNNLEMYARKVPLLQVIKYMPKSIELANAVALEQAAAAGASQGLDLQGVIEGTWTPAEPDESSAEGRPPAEGQATPAPAEPDPEVQRVKSELNLE